VWDLTVSSVAIRLAIEPRLWNLQPILLALFEMLTWQLANGALQPVNFSKRRVTLRLCFRHRPLGPG
jgi:hypothetical protein